MESVADNEQPHPQAPAFGCSRWIIMF